VGGIDEGVEEKIDHHPTAAPGNAEAGQRSVEVVAAVVVVVVLGSAGHGETIMAAHGPMVSCMTSISTVISWS
jgi:hypothetical protein